MLQVTKPKEGQYKPAMSFYIDLVNDDFQLYKLKINYEEFRSFIMSLPKERLEYRYREDKWTIKEILVHIIDTERIFAYRSLRIARNDQLDLRAFDQELYVPHSNANARSVENILEEYEAIRKSTFLLFTSFDENAWNRIGSSDAHPLSVRAALYIIAGHELHHFNVIKERYL